MEPNAMRAITILGATGPTGTLVTRQLTAEGATVIAVMRSADRQAEFEALGARVILADAMDRDSLFPALEKAAQSTDTLLNLLGGNPFQPPESWPDREGVMNTTDAAIAAGFRRYILVTSVGTGASWEFVPSDAYIRPILELKSAAEEHLKTTSLDWTIIKPGGLGPPDYRIKRGNPLITENHGVRGLIDREDLAAVITRVLAAPPPSVLHRELYAVVDRLEEHAGSAEPFPLPV